MLKIRLGNRYEKGDVLRTQRGKLIKIEKVEKLNYRVTNIFNDPEPREFDKLYINQTATYLGTSEKIVRILYKDNQSQFEGLETILEKVRFP